MTFSILVYLIFGIWAFMCFRHWWKLLALKRKYRVSFFSLKEVLSEEDLKLLKAENRRMGFVFIIIVAALLILFVLQITGKLFPADKL